MINQQTPAPIPAPTPPTSYPPPTTSFSFQTPVPQPARQSWATSTNPPTPHFTDSASFFRPRVRTDSCSFCMQSGHHICKCPSTQEYVRTGRTLVMGDRLHHPNGQSIPNDGSGRGLKHSIDAWLATQPQDAPAPTQVSFSCEAPPHIPHTFSNRVPSARIKEVAEAHIMQVINTSPSEEEADSDNEVRLLPKSSLQKGRSARPTRPNCWSSRHLSPSPLLFPSHPLPLPPLPLLPLPPLSQSPPPLLHQLRLHHSTDIIPQQKTNS